MGKARTVGQDRQTGPGWGIWAGQKGPASWVAQDGRAGGAAGSDGGAWDDRPVPGPGGAAERPGGAGDLASGWVTQQGQVGPRGWWRGHRAGDSAVTLTGPHAGRAAAHLLPKGSRQGRRSTPPLRSRSTFTPFTVLPPFAVLLPFAVQT